MIEPVDPRYLHDVWPWVREGLEKLIRKTKQDWLPEDIYADLKSQVAALFLIFAEQEQIGFIVLQTWPTPTGPVLFVRALWCVPGSLRPFKDDFMAALATKARSVGARTIQMRSPRMWVQEGFKLKEYVYEMGV